MKGIVVRVHEDEGIRTGVVVSEGPKFIGVIWPDSGGIKIIKLHGRDARITPTDYSLTKAKKSLRRMGRAFGITKSARKALR